MNANTFQERNAKRWDALEQTLNAVDSRRATKEQLTELPEMFRQACSDLSLAQSRMYSLPLCERLNQLVIRCYQHIHSDKRTGLSRIVDFFWRKLPRLVREEARLFWVCQAFFWIPMIVIWISVYFDARWMQAILGPEGMMQMEQGFGEDGGLEGHRDTFAQNFGMFAFYIFNNVGIDLRIFASGIFAGIGTLFAIVFNGLHMGAAFAYLDHAGTPVKLINWVSGHGFIEIMGMILAGMAGFLIGMAVIKPGRLTRKEALKFKAMRGVQLLLGAATMTFIAAIIEGFWSPLPLHPLIKISFGMAFALILSAYLAFAGREARET